MRPPPLRVLATIALAIAGLLALAFMREMPTPCVTPGGVEATMDPGAWPVCPR